MDIYHWETTTTAVIYIAETPKLLKCGRADMNKAGLSNKYVIKFKSLAYLTAVVPGIDRNFCFDIHISLN